MWPAAAAAIPPGIAALGGLIGGNEQNAANAKQARLNREFQERMSNTAYQRTTADMRAAGLNPALAYQQGGASSPSGATSAPQQNVLGNATTSAVAAAQGAAQIQATKAQIEKTREETRSVRWDTDMKSVWTKYETAARLAEIMSRHSKATAQGGNLYDDKGRSLGAEGNEAYIARIINQMEADLKMTQAGARQTEQEIGIRRPYEEAAKTWWGRKVSPFMNDAKTAGTLGASFAAPFVLRGRAAAAAAAKAKKEIWSW